MEIEHFDLSDLGVLTASGADAAQFLQGQLSNDLRKLACGASQLSALHTVQGRVQALLRVLRDTDTSYLLIMPRALIADVVTTLRKRVFRARVTLTDNSAEWQIQGASVPPPNKLHAVVDESGRCLVLDRALRAPSRGRDAWRALDIAAGLPQVYPESQGEFVAQMLNLDLLGGIAFDKGCYIGQEIIARAHYRGRVKRRMQRFALATQAPPAAGSTVTLPSGDAAIVVDACQTEAGCELLAVATIPAAGALPLPYQLPLD